MRESEIDPVLRSLLNKLRFQMEDALLERYRLSLRQVLDLFLSFASRDPDFETYQQKNPVFFLDPKT